MSSAVNCEAPVAGAENPEPVFRSGHAGSSITNRIWTGTWQRWLLLPAVALLCFLSGCATTPPPPAQPAEPQGPEVLTDPVPGLVKYRVDEGDRLALSLRDGREEWLTVDKVDEDVIRGKYNIDVAIADIHELEILPQRAQSSVKEATVGILGMSVLIPLSIALFPIALPAVFIIDWDKPKHWNDGLLCRVVAHPEYHGYTSDGLVAEGEERPVLDDVRKEFDKRQLDCDALFRGDAEFSCAKQHDSGPAFEDCSATNMARSLAGFTWFYHWSGTALCRVQQDPAANDYLASASAEEQAYIVNQVSAALQSAKVDCPKVETPEAEQATPSDQAGIVESEAQQTSAESS